MWLFLPVDYRIKILRSHITTLAQWSSWVPMCSKVSRFEAHLALPTPEIRSLKTYLSQHPTVLSSKLDIAITVSLQTTTGFNMPLLTWMLRYSWKDKTNGFCLFEQKLCICRKRQSDFCLFHIFDSVLFGSWNRPLLVAFYIFFPRTLTILERITVKMVSSFTGLDFYVTKQLNHRHLREIDRSLP